MAKRGLGREHIRKATQRHESYPHPLASCMMPFVAVGVLFALAFGAFYVWQSRMPRDTTIPPVAGLTQDEAIRELQQFNLKPKVVEERQRSEKVAAGSVITSEPAAGRRVKMGRTVMLIVSDGSAFTRVPDVRELTLGNAVDRLKDHGLQVTSETYAHHDTIPFDRVIDISPTPDTKIKRGGAVALVVSKGKEERRSRYAMGPRLHSSVISLTLPRDGGETQDVRIEVHDNDGQRIVYQEPRAPGDTLVYTAQGRGDMTVKVFYGTRLLLTRTL